MTLMTDKILEQESKYVPPHGDTLVDMVIHEKRQALQMIDGCKGVLRIRGHTARDIINIAHGFYSPLQGFMNKAEVESVCRHMTLPSGEIWPLPVLLDISDTALTQLGAESGDHILLEYHNIPFAVLEAAEIFSFDPHTMVEGIYGVDNVDHPGIRRYHSLADTFLAGPVWLVNEPVFQEPFNRFFYTPKQIRKRFFRRHWRKVLAVLATSVPHQGHEWAMKSSFLQHTGRGLLVNCAVGEKSIGECIDEAVLLCHHELEEAGYFNNFMHMTAMVLWDKQYAGAREAVMHAIIAKNMGCTGHMFGKDHANPPGFGTPWAAHRVFQSLPDLGIEPILAREWFYCEKCDGITYSEFCGHKDIQEPVRSVNVCNLLSTGIKPPSYLLRPEVFDVSIGAADSYGFGDGYVTEEYLRKRNPIFTLSKL